MTEQGTLPLALNYAVNEEVGDVAADRRLAAVVKWILVVQVAVLLLEIGAAAVAFARDVTQLSWWAAYNLGTAAVLLYLMIRSIRLLAHRRYDTLTFALVLLLAVAPSLLSWGFSLMGDWMRLVQSLSRYSAMLLLGNMHLLMLLTLLRQNSGTWMRRLHWLAILVIAFCLRDLIARNIEVLFVAQPPRNAFGVEMSRWMKPTWLEAGLIAGAAGLWLLRREGNRILIRLVAAWFLVYAGTDLYQQHFNMMFLGYVDLPRLWMALYDLKLFVVAALPLAFLAWFTFRFTDAERRGLGQKAMLAEPI